MDERKRKIAKLAIGVVAEVCVAIVAEYGSSLSDDEASTDDEAQLQRRKCKRKRRKSSQMPRIRSFIADAVDKYNETEFQSHFQLSQAAFHWLLGKLECQLNSKRVAGRQTICPKKQLLAVLWILATPDSFRSVACRFDLSSRTLHACFLCVIRALNVLSPTVIKWPDTDQRYRIAINFQHMAGMPGVIGAIDSTYIKIKAPKENAEVYINRKCFYAMTLQAICDDQRRFISTFAGYPSLVSDVRIFRNSHIYKSIVQNPATYFSSNQYIIGDKAYEPKLFCVPPYREGQNFTPWQRSFNHLHAKTRQVIERSFALLFGRFRRLKDLDMTQTDWIPCTIIAACVLYNICLAHSYDYLQNQFEKEGIVFLQLRTEQDGESTLMTPASFPTNDEGKQFRNDLARLMGLIEEADDNNEI